MKSNFIKSFQIMKKILAWGLAAIMSFGLSGVALGASDDLKMTGTVVEVNFPTMTIETVKKERVDFSMEGGIKPKVGDEVTVIYQINRRGKWIAYKLEKAGKAK